MLKSYKLTQGQKNLGAVYTSRHLAVWLAEHLKTLGCDPDIVVDPAAGAGALLKASKVVFPKAQSAGFDLDKIAHNLLVEEGLATTNYPCDALLIEDWFANFEEAIKLVFSNPPWGAEIDSATSNVYKRNFESAWGNFDIFDLFVERTIKTLKSGDWAALFLPDSLLLENHARTRRMIHDNVLVHSVTRLPEGAFPGVNMGSLAVIVQKKSLPSNHTVKFSRISRADYFSGQPTPTLIETYRVQNEIKVEQSEWIRSPAANWHANLIYGGSVDSVTDLLHHCSQANGSTWDLWFTTGRGLEIGKKALIKGYPPVSISDQMIPIAVGEDVNRRQVAPSRLLILGDANDGLKLKNEFVPGPRLLVRKTGIGIKASVAEDIVTTQTVYHFRANPQAPKYALHYAAGFLTSRVLIAIHLAKTGETEWRSHPYITQKVIRDLQLPIPVAGSHQESIAKEIASLSMRLHLQEDFELEERLDHLVAELLGHGEQLVKWAITFLANIDGCSYTKMLSAGLSKKKTA